MNQIKRHALIVGINDWGIGSGSARPKVQFAVEDGLLMEKFLEACGFAVKHLFDGHATGDEVKKNLRELASQLSERDLLVFYFAGHGQTHNGQHFLHFRNTEGADSGQFMCLQEIKGTMSEGGKFTPLIILDTCRTSAGTGSSSRGEPFVRDLGGMPPTSSNPSVIFHACLEGQKARELEEKRNGLLTSTFVKLGKERLRKENRVILDEHFRLELRKEMFAEATKRNWAQDPSITDEILKPICLCGNPDAEMRSPQRDLVTIGDYLKFAGEIGWLGTGSAYGKTLLQVIFTKAGRQWFESKEGEASYKQWLGKLDGEMTKGSELDKNGPVLGISWNEVMLFSNWRTLHQLYPKEMPGELSVIDAEALSKKMAFHWDGSTSENTGFRPPTFREYKEAYAQRPKDILSRYPQPMEWLFESCFSPGTPEIARKLRVDDGLNKLAIQVPTLVCQDIPPAKKIAQAGFRLVNPNPPNPERRLV